MDSYKDFDKSPIVDDNISFHGHSFRKREIALGGVALIALIVCVILAAVLASKSAGGGGGPIVNPTVATDTNTTANPVTTPTTTTTPSTTTVGMTTTPQPSKCDNMCFTSSCFQITANVMESMKKDVNPCDNFFQYACGSWPQNHPLKPDRSQATPAWNIYYKNQEKLRRIMETPYDTNRKWETEKKLKDYFESCTDHYGKMILQGNPFLDKVVSKSGGWYVIGTLNETTYDFEDAFRKTHVDFWTDALFTFTLRTDWKDWRDIAIQIDLSGTGLSWFYYVRPDSGRYISEYKNFMRTVAGYLLRDSGVQLEDAEKERRLDTFVNDAYMIEFGLANITQHVDPSEDPHEYENRLTLTQLNTLTNQAIKWDDFFIYMFKDAGVTADTPVVVLESEYLKRMGEMINNLGVNKTRILNNYMTWRLAHKYVQDLSWDYIHANREFYVSMTGEAEFLGTWRYCMGIVDRDMGEAVSSLFVKDHFSSANKEKSAEIVDYLKTALVDSITANKWMDEETRTKAEKKIHDSLYKMGYPDFMVNDDNLDQIYKSLQIDKYDYFQNRMNMNKFYKTDWNRRLKTGTNVNEWTYNTYAVVAEYYNPWKELIVPAGLLQWPLYDHKLPHYMNFGALGVILGHNLVHAIDQIGSQYKLDGSHFGVWWSNNTKTRYEELKKCIVKAYTNKTMGPYTLGASGSPITVPVDPTGYSTEAFAETSGVRLAYKAFKKWEAANKVERSAPGLSNTNDQMFFLSYAQSNCFNRNQNEAFSQAARGIVQENIKVNMALSQVKEFQDAFKCEAKSNMVANELCNMY